MREGGDEECVEKRVYYRIVSGELLGCSDLVREEEAWDGKLEAWTR